MNYAEQYERYRAWVEQALTEALPETDFPQKNVEDAMRYSLLGGGKRLRGVLVLAFCQLLGGNTSTALPLACAVEMVHAYSLIHDDLPCMDNDDLRRGKPTCHIRFGEAIALLAGDGLLTGAFEAICANGALSDCQKAQAVRILSQAAGSRGMIGGQVIDIEHEGKPLDKPLLDILHSLKTGALIRASVGLGCCAANAGPEAAAAADRYAALLGLVFQIVDDLLDVTATEAELGKTIGSDMQNSKTTYATLYGLEASRRIVQELVGQAEEVLITLPSNTFMIELTRKMAVRTK